MTLWPSAPASTDISRCLSGAKYFFLREVLAVYQSIYDDESRWMRLVGQDKRVYFVYTGKSLSPLKRKELRLGKRKAETAFLISAAAIGRTAFDDFAFSAEGARLTNEAVGRNKMQCSR